MNQAVRRRLEALGINDEYKIEDYKKIQGDLEQLLIQATEKSENIRKQLENARANKKLAQKAIDRKMQERSSLDITTKEQLTILNIEQAIEQLENKKNVLDKMVGKILHDLEEADGVVGQGTEEA